MKSLVTHNLGRSLSILRAMVTAAISGTSLLGQRDGCGTEDNFYLFPIIAFIALYLTNTSKLHQFESKALQ